MNNKRKQRRKRIGAVRHKASIFGYALYSKEQLQSRSYSKLSQNHFYLIDSKTGSIIVQGNLSKIEVVIERYWSIKAFI
jgi:hypothetical protein